MKPGQVQARAGDAPQLPLVMGDHVIIINLETCTSGLIGFHTSLKTGCESRRLLIGNLEEKI
jgi:hypothetical protein